MLSKLTEGPKVVGAKQTRRAILSGRAAAVYLAQDADPRVTGAIRDLCAEHGVAVYDVPAMKQLGAACGIAVGASVAAAVN